jgi:hypothetical protein
MNLWIFSKNEVDIMQPILHLEQMIDWKAASGPAEAINLNSSKSNMAKNQTNSVQQHNPCVSYDEENRTICVTWIGCLLAMRYQLMLVGT